jgi:hypothetical protein
MHQIFRELFVSTGFMPASYDVGKHLVTNLMNENKKNYINAIKIAI